MERALPIVDATILRQLAPRYNGARGARQAANITAAGPFFAAAMAHVGIDTVLRQAHFLAQICEESWGFSDLVEEDSGERYEGAARLGNTRPGDGKRYKGRGFLQLTGRSNYARYSRELGMDLLDHPDLAARPDVAVLSACAFWRVHHLNTLADRDDVRAVTHRVNGGFNGLGARTAYLRHAKILLGEAWIEHALDDACEDARLAFDGISHLFSA